MDHLASLLLGPQYKNIPKDEMLLRFGLIVISIIYLACHSFFMVYYRIHGILALSNINIFSTIIYAALLFANRKRLRPFSSIFVVLELAIYCFLSCYYVGWSVGTQWYLTIMTVPVYFMYQIPSKVRKFSVVIFALSMIGCYILKLSGPPVYDNTRLLVMEAFNVVMAVGGPVMIISLLHLGNKITERAYQFAIDSLTEEANRDVLTGLWNRRFAEQYLQALYRETAQKKRAFIGILDIDLFKNVNDAFGHDVGDEVLKWLSQEAQSSFRHSDIIARWGGEEFLLIVTDTDEKGAQKAFENFVAKIRDASLTVQDHYIRITITIGYAACAYTENYHDCIRQSDEALYYGKNHGRDQVNRTERVA